MVAAAPPVKTAPPAVRIRKEAGTVTVRWDTILRHVPPLTTPALETTPAWREAPVYRQTVSPLITPTASVQGDSQVEILTNVHN